MSAMVIAGDEVATLKLGIQDAIESAHFVGVAARGIGNLPLVEDEGRRIVAEMIALAGVGAKVGHLPMHPLVDLHAGPLVARIELPGLAAEVLEDGAGLEDGDRSATGAVGIDDGGHAIVRADGEEFARELLPAADVHRLDRIRQAHLLERDGDLVAIRRRPVVDFDRLLHRLTPCCVRSDATMAAWLRDGQAEIARCVRSVDVQPRPRTAVGSGERS
jgi:hypothetical protein